MSTKPRKVEIIVLGRGLAAAALAALLVARGRAVALLVEEPGWNTGIHTVAPGEGTATAALLAEWQAAGLPGISREESRWRLDYGHLLPALGERVAAGERSSVALGTRVRGISVIEGAILGAIAEDARYDARVLVNAAEDERHAAFARMMRAPQTVKGAWHIRDVAAAVQLAEQIKEKP